MRKTLFVSMLCLCATAAFSQQPKTEPLNIKPGQWQVTESYSVTGLPSGTTARTITYKSCVNQKDLGTNPFNDPDEKCTWTVLNSDASNMEVRGKSCDFGDVKGNVHLKLHAVDQEHVTGSGEWAADGSGASMNGSATGTGKWISSTCSAQ